MRFHSTLTDARHADKKFGRKTNKKKFNTRIGL